MALISKRKIVEEYIANNKSKYKDDEKSFLINTLRECGYIYYGKADPASLCMDRFLSGAGGTWEFDLQQLFAEDDGAKTRVYAECARRSAGLLTIAEKQKAAYQSIPGAGVLPGETMSRLVANSAFRNLPAPGLASTEEHSRLEQAAIDPIITIFQHNYVKPAWNGALGTFPVRYEIVSKSVDIRRIFVRLSGDNVYRWHSDDANRATQPLHAIGSRLIELGIAKEFTMVAKPRIFSVDISVPTMPRIEDVIVMTSEFQTNPKNGRSDGMIERYVEKRFGQ